MGCSFTWGEGLYFYSGLENLPFQKNHGFNESTMRPPFDSYRKKYRWPRLLADKLDSWEYTSDVGNGGANISHYSYCIHTPLLRGDIKYSDFDYFVWQFTDIMRDYPGGYEAVASLQDEELEVVHKTETDRFLNFAESVTTEWEKNGVTVLVLNWHGDYKDNVKYNKLFKNRHVPIHFEGTDYFCLTDVIGSGYDGIDLKKTHKDDNNTVTYKVHIGSLNTHTRTKLTIRDDFTKEGFQTNDNHLNKAGNQIISDSIYKKIKELEKQGKQQINQNLI